ncbi:MAG: hypothetical protein CMK78_12565 [Pseudomonadales bacterium]|nr:hypothetical protein [Pseudomonadales bacterium]
MRRVISDSIAFFMSTLFGRSSVIVVSVIAVNRMSSAESAELILYLSLFQLFLVFSVSGLANVAVKRIVPVKQDFDGLSTVLTSLMLQTFVVSMVVALFYYFYISVFLEGAGGDCYLAVLFSLSLVAQCFILLAQSMLQGGGYFFEQLYISLFLFVFVSAFSMFGGGGAANFALNFLLSNVAAMFCAIAMLFWKYSFCWRWRFTEFYMGVKEVLPLMLSSSVVPICLAYGIGYFSKYAIAEQSLFYNTAQQWRGVISLVPAVIIQVLLPRLFSVMDASLKKKLWMNICIVMALVVLFVSIAGGGLVILGLEFFYGDEFAGAERVFFLVILASALASVNSLMGTYFLVNASYKIMVLVNLVWALGYVVMLHFMLWQYTAELLALVLVFSYVLHAFVQLFFVRRGAYAR